MAHVFKKDGIYYLRYKDQTGKWRKKSCGKNANRADATFLAKQQSAKELNYHHKSPVRIVDIGLVQALKTFRDTVIPRSCRGVQKEQSSIKREQVMIDNFLGFLEKERFSCFSDISTETLDKYLKGRTVKELGYRKVGPDTHVKERGMLRRFYDWAILQYYCQENPAQSLIVPRPTRKKPRFFSNEELQKIFEAASDRYRDIFMFLFYTGLRTGELSNLQWSDYDKAHNTLVLRVVSSDRSKRQPGNKTKREETIPVSKPAAKILEHRHQQGENKTHIFLNEHGNRLDDDNIYRNLMRILKKEKISGASPHTFRHTFASHLVIKGVSIYLVRDLLRHKSVRETEIYAHLSKEATRNAVEMLTI